MYKLRIYKTYGPNKGDLVTEEFFTTCKEMIARYDELFVKYSAYNPTAWVKHYNEWIRLSGF